MSMHNGFMNSTVACSGFKTVDLDGLNLVAGGGCKCLCTCGYKKEKGHHHFIYNTAQLEPFVHLRAGMTFTEAAELLSAGAEAIRLAQSKALVLDNLRFAKEYIFRGSDGYKFVYVPVVHKGHLRPRDLIVRLFAAIPLRDERLTELLKQIKKEKDDSQALTMLERFAASFLNPAAMAQRDPMVASEGETTVLSQAQPDFAAEGETTVLSQAQPDFAAEGETTVLSQAQPDFAAEGETTVLSQAQPDFAAEGETTVLSQMEPQPTDAQFHTVYSGASTDRLTAFIQDTAAESETTVLSQTPAADETTLLSALAPEQRTVISTQDSVYMLQLIRLATGEKIPVEITPFTIGKDGQKVDYVLDSNSVSRQHATIIFEDGVYYVVDNGSTNGTMIEGVRLRPFEQTELGGGYILSLGSETFQTSLERR